MQKPNKYTKRSTLIIPNPNLKVSFGHNLITYYKRYMIYEKITWTSWSPKLFSSDCQVKNRLFRRLRKTYSKLLGRKKYMILLILKSSFNASNLFMFVKLSGDYAKELDSQRDFSGAFPASFSLVGRSWRQIVFQYLDMHYFLCIIF